MSFIYLFFELFAGITFPIILSVHCEWLQPLSTKKCTYFTNIYFILSSSNVAIYRELTYK